MNGEQLAQYMPVVRQALAVNSFLFLYYFMPNFTSFLLAALSIIILFAPNALQQLSCCQDASCCSPNALFRSYLGLSGVRKLMVIVGFGVLAQLTYLFPSWFVLLLAAQVVAFWDLLVGFGLVEISVGVINSTESALTKFFNLIPRYQE